MATLVLSTVGTILGGPIGGALGSLVGQAIDQNLFGPPPRRGPRLGDLRVQTSSYGTPIPRVYGRMRVAGTVVWATDLEEEEVKSGGGKGSPGTISYTYSTSFAVALSSRGAQSVGRIWADGKLLRGANGKLKTGGKFRFHRGSEKQRTDPLIASIEGNGGSPGFRGLALAVFEDLALADYGNRIPSLTFELIADAAPPSVASIIGDASGGLIEVGAGSASVTGFAALGSDRAAAIEPLIELWGGAYFDDGSRVRVVEGGVPLTIAGREVMGCSADAGEISAIAERRQEPADALPTALTIEYYDPARDYQAGQMRASLAAGGRGQRRIDSAATLTAAAAKGLASDALARRWAGRDRLTLRLAPSFIDLRPGQVLRIAPIPGLYRAEEVAIDGLVVIVEARRTHLPGGLLAADPGRGNVDPDGELGGSVPVLFDPPGLPFSSESPGVLLVLGCDGAFKPTPVELTANGQPLTRVVVERAAVTGSAATVLAPGQVQLVDAVTAVEIICSNPDSLLFNADADALAMGANAAMLGAELIQFGRAEAMGGGRYLLSRLLRARRGTEWAMAGHAAGEAFVLLDPARLAFVAIEPGMIGASIEARAHGIEDDPAAPPTASVVAAGEAMRPMSPCRVRGAIGPGGLALSWLARRSEALAWVDGADPDVSGARFAVRVARGGGVLVREITVAALSLTASELAGIGSGPIDIEISELGGFGPSRPATLTLAA